MFFMRFPIDAVFLARPAADGCPEGRRRQARPAAMDGHRPARSRGGRRAGAAGRRRSTRAARSPVMSSASADPGGLIARLFEKRVVAGRLPAGSAPDPARRHRGIPAARRRDDGVVRRDRRAGVLAGSRPVRRRRVHVRPDRDARRRQLRLLVPTAARPGPRTLHRPDLGGHVQRDLDGPAADLPVVARRAQRARGTRADRLPAGRRRASRSGTSIS